MARESRPVRSQVQRRASPRLGALLLVGIGLSLSGCLQMVQRPPPDTTSMGPWWESGESPPPGDLAVPQAGEDTEAKRSVPEPAPPPAQRRTASEATHPAERNHDDRAFVKQVNEYAYWCVQRELWEEARIHLEHALAQDSLAASLHNNLGVVYEQCGRQEEALEAYERATQLGSTEAYRANLAYLEERVRESSATPDSTAPQGEAPRPEPQNPNGQ